MNSSIAVCAGPVIIYWSSIIISLGLLAALFMTLSLQKVSGGRSAAVFVFLPLAIALSVPLCRLIHWYCHAEQYSSLLSALTDYSVGSYVLPGALLGSWLAAVLCAKLRLTPSAAQLLDAFAPGAALAVAFIRLSALFNNSCRSKIAVQVPALQQLPIGSGIVNSAGATEYRFATFFIHFLLMLLICYMLLRFFLRRRNAAMKDGRPEGCTARLFLLLYCASELLMDSTRYDSSFMHFNSFVSIVQMISALCILGLLIYYSGRSLRANGMRFYHWLLWIGYFLTLAGTGIAEYLVQRHGNWYLGCYAGMSICCILMALSVWLMYRSCCRKAVRSE